MHAACSFEKAHPTEPTGVHTLITLYYEVYLFCARECTACFFSACIKELALFRCRIQLKLPWIGSLPRDGISYSYGVRGPAFCKRLSADPVDIL